MMNKNLYKKNIDIMRNRFEDIVEYLLQSDETLDEKIDKDINPQIVYFDGSPKLVIEKNGKYIQLDSLYNSKEMLETWRKCFDVEQVLDSKILLFGFGCGMFAREILKTTPKDSTLVVYEPSDKIFRLVLETYDLSDILNDQRFIILLGPVTEKIGINNAYAKILTYNDYYNAKQLFHLNYELLFVNELQEYLEGVQEASLTVEANQTLFANCGMECNENTLRNAKYFVDSFSLDAIKDNMPCDFPAIIVAGGPSLDKNIHQLKYAKNKALIVATDTSLNALAKAGIVPDIAISTDALKGEKYFAHEVSRRIPLVCGFHVGYKAMKAHTGKKFFKNEFKPFIQEYLENTDKILPVILSGGSVANDALYLAYYLGSRRIILIGQDLAYTDDKTHSTATVEGEVQGDKPEFRYEKWEEGIDGKPIRSSYQFVLYRNWIEGMIVKNDDLHVIDATEGGILIHGTEIMTLKDAIDRECTYTYDYGGIIDMAQPLLTECEGNDFINHMFTLSQELEKIKSLCQEGVAKYKTVKRTWNKDFLSQKKAVAYIRAIGEISKQIELIPGLEFVRNRIQDRINKTLRTVNITKSDKNEEMLEVCKVGIESFNDMIEAISEIVSQTEILKEDLIK